MRLMPPPVASTYQEIITQMKKAYAKTSGEIQQADEEGLILRNQSQGLPTLPPRPD